MYQTCQRVSTVLNELTSKQSPVSWTGFESPNSSTSQRIGAAVSRHVLDTFQPESLPMVAPPSSTIHIHIHIHSHPPPPFCLQQRHIPPTLFLGPGNPWSWSTLSEISHSTLHSALLPSSHPLSHLFSSQYLKPYFLTHYHEYPHSNHSPIFTYNATTQQALTLPFDPHPLTSETYTTLAVKTHFGLDPLTKTHKVKLVKWTLAILESNPRVIKMVCTVLTLGSSSNNNGSWRKINVNPGLRFNSTKYM